MERQFFSGNTIEQAVMAAARYYGLEPSRVAYRLRDKKHGFLNVRRRIVIEVDPSAPELAEGAETAPPEAAGHSGRESAPPAAAASAAPRSAASPATPSRSSAPPAAAPGTDLFAGTAEDDLGGDEFKVEGFEDEGFEDGEDVGEDFGEDDSGEEGFGEDDFGEEDFGEDDFEDEEDFGEDDAEEDEDGVLDDGTSRDGGVWSYRKAVLEEFAEEAEEEEEEREVVAFEKALDEVLELMDLDVEWSVEKVEEGYEIVLEGRDENLLVEDDGRLLRSIEHLLPRLVRGLLGYGLPCTVDCNDFHSNREVELKELADGMAERVRRQGKAQRLEPMNPADRRIVHMTLADDPTVRTESEGEGYIKRVRILPA